MFLGKNVGPSNIIVFISPEMTESYGEVITKIIESFFKILQVSLKET
jgi:hypothetical protein